MMDDDQRRLRLFKELYLEDGDLHCDGQGRTRKFRWRNVGALVCCKRRKKILQRNTVKDKYLYCRKR